MKTGVALLAFLVATAGPGGAARAGFFDDLTNQVKSGIQQGIEQGVEQMTHPQAEPRKTSKPAPQAPVANSQAPVANSNAPRFDHAWVVEIQQNLTKQGFHPGPIDGSFGEGTQKAIQSFERSRGMPVTGLPTPRVMDALRARSQAKASPHFDKRNQPKSGTSTASGSAGSATPKKSNTRNKPRSSGVAAAARAGKKAAPVTVGGAIWQGTAKCGPEPVYVTLSTELMRSQNGFVQMELADSPGGAPWARGYGRMNHNAGYGYSVSVIWSFVAMDLYQGVGRIDQLNGRNALRLSDDGQRLVGSLSKDAYHRCKNAVTLRKMPAAFANGGIVSAEDLSKEFRGTVGCQYDGLSNSARIWAVKLNLKPAGKSDLDGTLTFSPIGDRAGKDLAAFTVIGQFDGASGKLTLVGDQWKKKTLSMKKPFDSTFELKNRGKRLIGETSLRSCGRGPTIIQLYAPGADFARRIAMPATPVPIMEWNTPSACVTLIKWTNQMLQETGGRSPYHMLVRKSHKIAIGLFADERFVPFFGKPFADLTADERKHVYKVSEACKMQSTFGKIMYESYAKIVVNDFFRYSKRTDSLELKRFRILRSRLSKEMAALKKKNVGVADIPSLKATLAGLDQRFSELWKTDKAQAKTLLESKLDAARGALVASVEDRVHKLPDDWAAFGAEKGLRSEIASLGPSRSQDQARLNHLLDAKLDAASDHILSDTAAGFRKTDPSLSALADLRSQIERQWLRIGRHVNSGGPGFKEVQAITAKFAEASFPVFSEKAKGMIDSGAEFEQRESQYGAVVNLYQSLVPSDRRFHDIFVKYATVVDGLRPVPTKKDLIAADGSPTSFGLKLATSAWIERMWGTIFGALPYDFSFITKSIHVSGLRKASCSGASAGGFWCNFHLQMSGSFPFVDLLSLVPSRARFSWQGTQWALVEAGGDSRLRRTTSYTEPYEQTCGLVLGCTAGEIGANGVMAGLW